MITEVKYTKAVESLISECGLPVSDLNRGHRFHYFCYGNSKFPDGVIVLEVLGDYGLLRSLSVKERRRKKGAGVALVAHLEEKAAQLGIKELFLLTTDAVGYFKRLNYYSADRNNAPIDIQNSTQFKDLCPSDSVLMKKTLP